MKFVSMFSGIEAASVAFGPLGWEAAAFAEIEKFPSAVLAHRFPSVPNVGDMTAVDWTKHRGADLVCGGPPCQAFSVAGLRQSLNDARGNLSLAYVRAIHDIQPRWCITENVPGWLNTADNAFGCFLAGLLGADTPLVSGLEGGGWPNAGVASGPRYGVAWRVLDAQYFGVPQRRRRVFVVGNIGGWRLAAKVLFEPAGLRRDFEEGSEEGEGFTEGPGHGVEGHWDGGPHPSLNQAAKGSGGIGASNQEIFSQKGGGLVPHPKRVSDNALRACDWKKSARGDGADNLIPTNHGVECFENRQDPILYGPIAGPQGAKDNGKAIYDMRGRGEGRTSPTLCSDHASRPSDMCPVVTYSVPAIGHIKNDDISSCVTKNSGAGGETQNPALVQSGVSVRRLTPRECERLQGFPDDWTLVPWRGKMATDGPRYKSIGNSWAVPVARWIGERIQMVEANR